jgi:hypothetical protein
LWISSIVGMESSSESHVALISEWCDNETRTITKILISISESCVGLLTEAILLVGVIIVWISVKLSNVFPVVTKLLSPVEVVETSNLSLHHVLDDILSMNIENNESSEHLTLQRS